MGVLLAGVEGAEEGGGEGGEEGAVGEGEGGLAFAADGEIGLPGDAAEDDDDLEVGEELEFLFEEGAAGGDFVGCWFVTGWGAVDGAGDPGVAEEEAVVAVGAGGLVGEAGVEEGLIEEVAGAVTGEDAAGAVGAVSAGGEAEDEEAGGGVAEGGDGAAPVGLVEIGAALDLRDEAAVLAEAGAALAGDDLLLKALQAH